MEEKYLVMVNPNYNNNKFYQMIPLKNDTWKAIYGRIGEDNGIYGRREKVYPAHMFHIKLQEKLCKGYLDQTTLHQSSKTTVSIKNPYKEIPEKAVKELVERLMSWSRQCIEENYTIDIQDVTNEMLYEGKKLLSDLIKMTDKEQFNEILIRLFHVLPRKMGKVNTYLAETTEDFDKIIRRESDLFDVMESQVTHQNGFLEESTVQQDMTILERYGLEIHAATEKQKNEVMRYLNNGLENKVRNVYHVINKRTQTTFDQYLASHSRPRVKLLWHGSKNENWFSIIEKGLLLRPNAAITGKMFGDGIYFATSARKSWGYTSSPNAYWTRQNSNTAIMALYATAYGTPADLYSRDKTYAGYGYLQFHKEYPNNSCLYAHGGTGMLLHDEIIFYREDQTTIKYLVEFNV